MIPRRLLLLLLLLLPPARPCPTVCLCGPPNSVDCSSLDLEAIPEDIPPETETLLLRDNRLSGQPTNRPLRKLQFLDLSANRIRELGRGLLFHGFAELRVLNLSLNRFRSVFNGVFRGCPHLRQLLMTHAQVRYMEEHVFEGLSQVLRLHLSHNQLNTLFPEWFRDMVQLRELYLDNNHISYVSGSCFASLVRLQHLSLSGNRIRGLNDKALSGLPNLTSLHLEDNHIAKVPSPALRAAAGLRTLRLGGNAFPHLSTGDFSNLRVEEIFLENVPELRLIERRAFSDLPYLRTLHLHHNPRLQFVDPEAFVGVPNLRILSLHGNCLSAIGREIIRTFRKPLQVSMFENPFLCDCNIKWILEILDKKSSETVRILNADRMLCDRPHEYRNVRVENLNRSQIPDQCPPVLVGSGNNTITKNIGEKLVFACRAHGIPAPRTHWILPNGSVHSPSAGEHPLAIDHLKLTDSGLYVCEARNALGQAALFNHLHVQNIDIHLFALNVASTFVTIVWNGTARNAFPEYEILYWRDSDAELSASRSEGDAKEGQCRSVTVSQFFRSYKINHLQPQSDYTLCLGVRNKEDGQYDRFSCTRARTQDATFLLGGIHRTSNVAVAAVLAIVSVGMAAGLCAVLALSKRFRQSSYVTSEKCLVSNMAPIPMEDMQRPLVAHS